MPGVMQAHEVCNENKERKNHGHIKIFLMTGRSLYMAVAEVKLHAGKQFFTQ